MDVLDTRLLARAPEQDMIAAKGLRITWFHGVSLLNPSKWPPMPMAVFE